MKVGFIGLGNMGAPMCGWLLEAGFPLVVFDLRRQAAAGLVERGAEWADSPALVAEQCDVVATCVPGPDEMEEAALGSGGIAEGLRPGAIYIDHTTNSPHVVRRVGTTLGERKAHMLDVPMDGGKEGALAGTLTLFAGGDEQALERARPVLESYSASIVWTGGLGTGAATKIAHNALAMSIDLLVTECLTLGSGAGVEGAAPADRGFPQRLRRRRKRHVQRAAAGHAVSGRLFSKVRAQARAQGLRTGGSTCVRARGADQDR